MKRKRDRYRETARNMERKRMIGIQKKRTLRGRKKNQWRERINRGVFKGKKKRERERYLENFLDESKVKSCLIELNKDRN